MGHMPDGSYSKAYDPSVIFLVTFFPSSPYAFFQKRIVPSQRTPNLTKFAKLLRTAEDFIKI